MPVHRDVRGANRDALSESEETPYGSSQTGNSLGETAKSLLTCKTVSHRLRIPLGF